VPYLYVMLAVLLRLLPHPWNVTPMGAMFLFSGATLQRKTTSLLVPLLALVVSDIVVIQLLYGGRHPWFDPFTWLGFLSIGLIGWILRSNASIVRLLAASLAGSLLFFLISNFGGEQKRRAQGILGWIEYSRQNALAVLGCKHRIG
jgi:hypothetical protein